jgi:ABC-type Fe3+/spermidine/putrescine transport system ATPase subunit
MLKITDLHKTYAGAPLLRGISFSVSAGETVCLLGASGSGKSTILRIIAGLEQPDNGSVQWQDQDLSDVPVHARNFGLVFQDYALFPHLSVFDNVAFGLRMRNLSADEIDRRTRAVIAQVNLSGFEKRRVTELSGGEQQRVALARTLAPRPRLIMFDEPLGALDRTLREDLINELRALLQREQIPVIYVTHDQEEAFALADRILLLHAGEIVQAGTPAEVHARPASAWVAYFLGLGNVIEGRVTARGVETPIGLFHPECDHVHRADESITLLIRPDAEAGEGLRGTVADVIFHGREFRITLQCGGLELFFYLSRAPKIGATISLKPETVQCLGSA